MRKLGLLVIDGYEAIVTRCDRGMLRGEFVGLNGGADFYAPDSESLALEGAASLREFLAMCREHNIKPR